MQISPVVAYACGPSVTGIGLLLLQFRQVKLHKAQITTLNVTYRKPFNRGYYNTGLGVQNFLNVGPLLFILSSPPFLNKLTTLRTHKTQYKRIRDLFISQLCQLQILWTWSGHLTWASLSSTKRESVPHLRYY